MKEKISILIVDDDIGMIETLRDIFELEGYEVHMAADGYKAIEMVKNTGFDVILMDIKMPGLNGVETFMQVHEISPGTKVIMMTAYALEDLIKKAITEGAYAVIYKPLDIDNALALIVSSQSGGIILAVDDDPATLKTFKDILHKKGYKIATAESGETAIRLVKETAFDIVFIDVKMPVMNGLETYLKIKKLHPSITVVMVTGYPQDTEELVQEAIEGSVYTCLYKPLDMDQVLALIERIRTHKAGKPGRENPPHEK